MLRKFRSKAYYNLINLPGWKTNRRIVVIESDDWGSIRMPSREVYQEFIRQGLRLKDSDYNRFDTLESNEDLLQLYDVLSSYSDYQGNHPVITANMVVGNPDFKRIIDNDFKEYYFESVIATLNRYHGRDQVASLWLDGNAKGFFHPQFHGREHVNVERWMNALRRRTPEIMFTFSHNTTFSGEGDYNFMEVLDFTSRDELSGMKESLDEGLDLFEDIFGYRSASFTPPCYTWDSDLERILFSKDVRYLQGLIVQLVPKGSFGSYKKRYHSLGSRSSAGLLHLMRNCFFEPTLSGKGDIVDDCLEKIAIAFAWRKPAVICSHRLNFMGEIDPRNRDVNLGLLRKLLDQILIHWPDIEFMTSDRLGDLISESDNLKG